MVLSYTKAPSQRQLRVAEQIRQLLAYYFISSDFYHPSLTDVMLTVHEVRISADLRMATAFIELSPQKLEGKALKQLFTELSAMGRHALAKKLTLRYLPEIRFVADDAAKRVEHLEEMLRNVNNTQNDRSS